METITTLNGNRQKQVKDLPKLKILGNHAALDWIEANTGLRFVPVAGGYEAQPVASWQIVALLTTYNFKTRYYDNWDSRNTLMLKSDNHVGFDVEHICYDCVKANHIHPGPLKQGQRLSC